jgi:hypothetical protein
MELVGSMKRLFGKFSRKQPPVANEPPAVEPALVQPASAEPPKPENLQLRPTSSASPPSDGDFDFELREPTPEEAAATILSQQDFADLDRMFLGMTSQKRTFQMSKAPLLAPGLPPSGDTKQPAEAIPQAAVPATPAVPPPVTTPPAPAAPPVKLVPAKEPLLKGFMEGFFLGKAIGGWVGDPAAPACRTLRVTAYLDGEEVASTIAGRTRADTPYGGYHIPFPDLKIWKYVLEDRLVIRAAREGEESVILEQLPGVRKQAHAARAEVASADGETAAESILVPKPKSTGDLSLVRVPVETESRNAAVIVGRDGFLFRYQDPTRLMAQYAARADQEDVKRDAAKWFTVFRARENLLAGADIAYVQSIIPEKATIVSDLAPAGMGPITARLAILEAMVDMQLHDDGAQPPACYRSLVAALRSCHTAGVPPYRRTTGGLRTAGVQLAFYQLIQKMALRLPDRAKEFETIAELCGHLVPGKESEPFSGDLGQVFDPPFYETEQLPDLTRLAPYVIGSPFKAQKTSSGAHYAWRNPAAPSSLKVLAFGAYAFEGGLGAGDLTWWFKTMFREFDLIVSVEMDPSHIRQIKPDVVVAISPERHLPNPPER